MANRCPPWQQHQFVQQLSIHTQPQGDFHSRHYINPRNYGPTALPSPPPSPRGYPSVKECSYPLRAEQRVGKVLAGVLRLDEVLGTGAYGVVYKATSLNSTYPAQYAVKALNKFNADGTKLEPRQQEFQRREIELHHAASLHPNVVSTLRILDDDDCTFVILEYCPEGDLFSNITERGRYIGNNDLARSVFLQILDAVEHCHRLGIYHRDLKPENILVSDNGQTVKLADFGLATRDSKSREFGCGSTFYMSPECLDQTSRPFYESATNDIWSLGVILVNLTCGRNPWKRASLEDSTYQAYMKDRKFLQSILPLSDSLSRILDRIFEVEPAKRITLKELKEEIYVCDRFTFPVPAEHVAALPSPPPSPMHYEQFARSRDSDSTSSLSDEGSLVSDHSDDSIDSCHSLPEEYPEMVVERPQDESYAFQELQSAVILQNFSHATRYPNTAPHSPPHCYQYYTPKPTLPSFQYQQYCETTTYYDCHQLYSHSFPCYAIPYASVC